MAARLRWGQWQWSQSAPVTAPARGDTSTSAVTNIPIVQRQYQQFPLCNIKQQQTGRGTQGDRFMAGAGKLIISSIMKVLWCVYPGCCYLRQMELMAVINNITYSSHTTTASHSRHAAPVTADGRASSTHYY